MTSEQKAFFCNLHNSFFYINRSHRMIEWSGLKQTLSQRDVQDVQKKCYNCDATGARWVLSREDELHSRHASLIKAIECLQLQLEAIEMELLPFSNNQRAALNGSAEMTYDLFWECLQVCFSAGNMDMYAKIWLKYPNHVATVLSNRHR